MNNTKVKEEEKKKAKRREPLKTTGDYNLIDFRDVQGLSKEERKALEIATHSLMKTEAFSTKDYLDGNGYLTNGFGFAFVTDPNTDPNHPYHRFSRSDRSIKTASKILREFVYGNYLKLKKDMPNFDKLNTDQKTAMLMVFHGRPGLIERGRNKHNQDLDTGLYRAMQEGRFDDVPEYFRWGENSPKNPGLKHRYHWMRELYRGKGAADDFYLTDYSKNNFTRSTTFPIYGSREVGYSDIGDFVEEYYEPTVGPDITLPELQINTAKGFNNWIQNPLRSTSQNYTPRDITSYRLQNHPEVTPGYELPYPGYMDLSTVENPLNVGYNSFGPGGFAYNWNVPKLQKPFTYDPFMLSQGLLTKRSPLDFKIEPPKFDPTAGLSYKSTETPKESSFNKFNTFMLNKGIPIAKGVLDMTSAITDNVNIKGLDAHRNSSNFRSNIGFNNSSNSDLINKAGNDFRYDWTSDGTFHKTAVENIMNTGKSGLAGFQIGNTIMPGVGGAIGGLVGLVGGGISSILGRDTAERRAKEAMALGENANTQAATNFNYDALRLDQLNDKELYDAYYALGGFL